MTDNCAAMTALLVHLADGALMPGDEARLHGHLAECPSCREELANQRTVRALLQGLPVDGARLGFTKRVMVAIRTDAEGRTRTWLDHLDFRRWTWRLVPIAAALALVAAVVSRTDTTGNQTAGTVATAADASDALPVSSALWSESVSESSLLSLMLTANADDALSTHRKDQ